MEGIESFDILPVVFDEVLIQLPLAVRVFVEDDADCEYMYNIGMQQIYLLLFPWHEQLLKLCLKMLSYLHLKLWVT